MPSRFPEGHLFVAATLGLLVLGLFTLQFIPFYEPFWGLDFHNIYVFQTCADALRDGIYSVSGDTCGDVAGRPFIYPPAMFHAFTWVRWFTFSQAIAIWNSAMILTIVGVGATWLWLDRRAHSGWRTVFLALFWLGLMGSLPFVFATERGNNDIIILGLWTAATVLFVGRRFALSGGLMGVATVLKVYPVIAVLAIVVGLARSRWRALVFLGAGSLSGVALASALWWQDTIHYLRSVLPRFAAVESVLFSTSHSTRSVDFDPAVSALIAVVLLGSWIVASWRKLPQEPLLVFAGAIAISTYFASTSHDYNLITAYPLLLLTAARALSPNQSALWTMASLASVFALVAGRGVVSPTILVLVQVASLVGIAWLVILDNPVEFAEADKGALVSGTQS